MPRLSAEQKWIIIDTETTGFSPIDHRVIEVGALVVQDNIVLTEYQALIKTVDHIPPFIRQFTGISQNMLFTQGQAPEIVFKQLRELIGDLPFVAHNVTFDYRFLDAEFKRYGLAPLTSHRVCTMRLSRRAMPHLINHRLSTIRAHLRIDSQAHRALTDAYVCHVLMKKYSHLVKLHE